MLRLQIKEHRKKKSKAYPFWHICAWEVTTHLLVPRRGKSTTSAKESSVTLSECVIVELYLATDFKAAWCFRLIPANYDNLCSVHYYWWDVASLSDAAMPVWCWAVAPAVRGGCLSHISHLHIIYTIFNKTGMGLAAITANGMEKQHSGSGYESLPSRKHSNYFSKNRQFIYCIHTQFITSMVLVGNNRDIWFTVAIKIILQNRKILSFYSISYPLQAILGDRNLYSLAKPKQSCWVETFFFFVSTIN